MPLRERLLTPARHGRFGRAGGPAGPPPLRGREAERAALEQALRDACTGEGTVLVLRGEAGIGKTALLRYAQERADGFRVLHAGGVQSEMELAFSGLHQLCAPLLGDLHRLPGPQRKALQAAFGLTDDELPDRFLVGLATLTLLADAAEHRPLLCLVDDVQWLDRASAQALSFVARRLHADAITILFAAREPHADTELDRLPRLDIAGLEPEDASALLAAAVGAPLDPRVHERLVAEARGNPLALLELPHGLDPAQLAGGFGLVATRPIAGDIEASFARRIRELPDDARALLLVAAADPLGDPDLVRRAARDAGADAPRAERDAVASGLLEIGERVLLRHPLVRSAAYHAATVDERHAAHAALATATDPERDPEHRAWHRAHAITAWDEEVADALERCADRARRRAGIAAAAAFLERAVELTPDPVRRVRRAVDAAQAKFEAGAFEAADRLLAIASLRPSDPLVRTRVERLRAQMTFARRRGGDAALQLLATAQRLEPLDPGLARETYREAFAAAIFAGPEGPETQLRDVAEAVLAGPRPPDPQAPAELLLDGLALRYTGGYAAAVPTLRRALTELRTEVALDERDMRWQWLGCWVAPDVWDDEAWLGCAVRGVEAARRRGASSVLPIALTFHAGASLHLGRFAEAQALNDETATLVDVGDQAPLVYGAVALAAWRGDAEATERLADVGVRDALARGEGRAIATVQYARAVLLNGLGRYGEACEAAREAARDDQLAVGGWGLIELVEAAVRSGRLDVAADAYRRLHARTTAGASAWALGADARSLALLNDGPDAEVHYRAAIEQLGRGRVTTHLLRAHLVYGEWLRRERRRVEARHHLRAAHELASAIGAQAFAARAQRELHATGETARKRRPDTRDDLTPQETQIALLARRGLTNPEIGAQLFISGRTVEWHLRKVFTKLGIGSRRELAAALEPSGSPLTQRKGST